MAETAKSITIKVMIEETIPAPVAAKLCEEFGEWLESQGLEITVRAGNVIDDRGYDDLARDFVEARSGSDL